MKTLIVIVSIIGLSAVAGSIFVGVKSFDGIVTEHPYEKGLAWDETRNKEKALGWSVDIGNGKFATGYNDVVLSVFDKHGKSHPGASVSITISRPSTPAYDMNYAVERIQDGSYRAAVDFPLHGNWDIDVDVSSGADKLLFKKRIFVDKKDIDVVFDIKPKPVSPMKELVFSVTVTEKGSPVTDASVIVDLTMPGMYMGTNRPALIHTANGKYEGRGIIQACPHGGKTWRAEVKITRHNRTYSESFTFEVE